MTAEPTGEQLTPIQGIRRELQRSIRRYMSGQENPNGGVGPASDSWFGPDSVTWLVHSDFSMMIGGVESLLVQVLHPPTMAGVADHSGYKDDPFGRLHRTGAFIGTTTFASSADAERKVRTIRKIHDRVTGTTPDGMPYEANDPHNLAWVHSTEVDGFLRAYQRYGRVELSAADADQYVDEMAKVGEALGVVDAPRSVAELNARLMSYDPELKYGAQARDAIRWLMFPPNKLAAQGPYAIILGAAINLLPSWARRKLWLPPRIPVVSDALVVPAAKALIGALDWVMEPEPELAEMREKRSA